MVKDITTGKFASLTRIHLWDHEPFAYEIREIAILKSLDHPNIVKLIDAYFPDHTARHLNLVYEFFNMDLNKYMKRHGLFDMIRLRKIMYQLLSAVSYCHTRKILHRNLKPQNLLVDTINQKIKLADVSLSRLGTIPNQPYMHEVVTLWYTAP